MEQPEIISGGRFTDNRGTLFYFNEFSFNEVKRFYFIEHPSDKIIRAWQGHKKEKKHFVVIKGSFLICAVKIDNWEHPSKNLKVEKFYLKENKEQILIIPPGYVNGMKALENNSKLLVFSSGNLEEGKKDIFRFDKNYWFDWNLLTDK